MKNTKPKLVEIGVYIKACAFVVIFAIHWSKGWPMPSNTAFFHWPLKFLPSLATYSPGKFHGQGSARHSATSNRHISHIYICI